MVNLLFCTSNDDTVDPSPFDPNPRKSEWPMLFHDYFGVH